MTQDLAFWVAVGLVSIFASVFVKVIAAKIPAQGLVELAAAA